MPDASTLTCVAALVVSVSSLMVSIWALRELGERDRREVEAYAEIARLLCRRGE